MPEAVLGATFGSDHLGVRSTGKGLGQLGSGEQHLRLSAIRRDFPGATERRRPGLQSIDCYRSAATRSILVALGSRLVVSALGLRPLRLRPRRGLDMRRPRRRASHLRPGSRGPGDRSPRHRSPRHRCPIARRTPDLRPNRWASVESRSAMDPIGSPPIPGAASIVVVPVRADDKRHDRKTDVAVPQNHDAPTLIRILETARVDPAAIGLGDDLAPAPVFVAPGHLHGCAGREPRDHRVVSLRAGAHIRLTNRVGGLCKRCGREKQARKH
jgi:hypothetical protein